MDNNWNQQNSPAYQQQPPPNGPNRWNNGVGVGHQQSLMQHGRMMQPGVQQQDQMQQLGTSQQQFSNNPSITPPRSFSTPQSQSLSHAQPQPSRSPSQAAGPQQQQQQQQQHQVQHAMAAPTVTSNPIQSPVKPSIPIPQTPEAQALDQERVTLLLEINQLLLQEIVDLQEQGKGGDVQSPAKMSPGEGGREDKPLASQEYVDCMRRMQSNLAYLANVAERASRPNQQNMPWPPLMGVPTTGPPSLPEMYIRLQNMFPAWKAQQAKAASMSPRPNPGLGTPTGVGQM